MTKTATPKIIQKIFKAVSKEYKIPISEILGRSRLKKNVVARQMAIYLIRIHCRLASTEIARIMGRFYTTIDFSIHQVEDLLKFNEEVQKHYNNLRSALAE